MRSEHKASCPRALGFLGGSFDPVHKGHLMMARIARAALQLDKVIFIPNASPPHKQGNFVSFDSRVRLLSLALYSLNHRQYDISLLEKDQGRRHYTFDTLLYLRHHYGPQVRLYFIIGMDSLLALPTWHKGLLLTSLANLIVLRRPHYDAGKIELLPPAIRSQVIELPAGGIRACNKELQERLRHDVCGHILVLDSPQFDVSSTQLRALLQGESGSEDRQQDSAGAADKASLTALQPQSSQSAQANPRLASRMPGQVLKYIRSHGLYSPQGADRRRFGRRESQ